jgi:predicted NBD/HSP70 family sugar kinase
VAARKRQTVKIGAASVEDAGIFFAVAVADDAGLAKWEITPHLWPWSGDVMTGRYSRRIIAEMIDTWFDDKVGANGGLAAVGISMFGLLKLGEGTVTATPRPDWLEPGDTQLDFRALFPAARWGEMPVVVGHDATTAALGEYQELCVNRKTAPLGFANVRVGAGIGVGILGDIGRARGVPRFGQVNVESGHIAVAPHPADKFEDFTCVPHSNKKYPCLEGRISEKAMLLRCKVGSLAEIENDNDVWEIVADYLSQLCVVLTDIIGPDVIVLGGRTMFDRNRKPRARLFKRVREIFADRVNLYPRHELMADTKEYIRAALLPEGYASLMGAAEIARQVVFRAS